MTSQAKTETTTALTRRGAVMATLAATVMPAKATGSIAGIDPDPIFAAIELHRQAWAQFDANTSELTEAGDYDELDLLMEAFGCAEDGLLDTIPTTIAGVSALLDYVAEHSRAGNTWGGGLVLFDDAPKSKWEENNGVSFFVYLHKNIVKALTHLKAGG